MSTTAFTWGLRDVMAGKRGLGLALAALLPTLLIAVVVGTGESIAGEERGLVTAVLTTTVVMPFLVGLIAIVAAGSVLRRPLEEGTLLYQLVRPQRRFTLGVVRALAAALATAAMAALALLALGLTLGQWNLVLPALPGLLLGGLALGALYGFLVSLHRYALGVAVVHLVAEAALARVDFRLNLWTLTYHVWGGMGELAQVASSEGTIPSVGGTLLVPAIAALVALAATGLLFRLRPFALNIGEQ